MTRPNIVLMLADYMGYGDFGFTGAPDIATPNLDRLVSAGVKCTDVCTAAPSCSPSRAALQTGLYPARVGVEVNVPYSDPNAGLDPQYKTVATFLRDAGYATGAVGKWHLGKDTQRDPNAHGYGDFFGFLDWAIDYFTHTLDDLETPGLKHNRETVEPRGYSIDVFTDAACGFIDQHSAEPFFLFVSWNASLPPQQPPEPPSVAPAPWEDGSRSDYSRIATALDEGVGRILKTLAKNGVSENTLVLFTVDHGGGKTARSDPFMHVGPDGGFGTLWESGVRVPLLVCWPERLNPGGVYDGLVSLMDIAPTVLTAAGVDPDQRFDGIDLLPLLSGAGKTDERSLFFRWLSSGVHQKAARRGSWKYLYDVRVEAEQLFDVDADPGETTDLSHEYPQLMQELKQALAKWEADVGPGPGEA